MVANALRNMVSAPMRAATISGGLLSIAALHQQRQWLAAAVQSGSKDIAELLVKNSATPMARQASLM
jgi:hypothetical protein